jgi:bifunctional non-homologous end joining protein LigD
MKAGAKNSAESKQPEVIQPMLATLVKEPFNDESYIYEVKWDGYRIIAHRLNGKIKLQSRGGEDYTRKYPSIVKALQAMKVDFIMDGEVVYLNTDGSPNFDALQRVNGQKAPIVYYAFDLLWKEGQNLMNKNLLERKDELEKLLEHNDTIKFSDHFEDGVTLF